jgi:hypothetical protein
MKFENFWTDERLALSAAHEFDIRYFAPPAELAPYINLFYIFRSDAELIRDVQPASAGHIMFFLSGHGEARFVDGKIQPSHAVSLIGPSSSAMQYIVTGPFHCIGLTFNPAGYTALTGQKALSGLNMLIDATSIFSDIFSGAFAPLTELNALADDAQRDAAMIDTLARFLMGRFRPLKPVPAAAIAMLFAALDERLDIDLREFYKTLPVAPRQMQRFCNDYLGSPPKYLVRKFRAVRAAMLLSDQACTPETRDHVQNHFYDQSHMIREINLFSGRTPKYLAGDSAPLLKMWFDSARESAQTGIYANAAQLARPE